MPSLRRIAVISAHTSPLATPGCRESGGMNVYVRELSRELGRRGYAIDVFTRRADAAAPDVVRPFENVRVVNLRAGPEGDTGKRSLGRHIGGFERELLAFQQSEAREYELVHSHYWLSGWAGLSLSERWRVPLVAMFHTLGELKSRVPVAGREPPRRVEVERRIAREADILVCASEHERRVLEETYGADPHRIAVVPCGVDLSRFRPLDKNAARHALGLNGRRALLFVGRIEPLKGLDLLLAAAARLKKQHDLQVLVVGGDGTDGDEVGRLRGLSRDLGLGGRVDFVGPVAHDRLPLYYNAADVCVVPSYYESFGLVALEAMACGIPVVASRVGGLTVTVREGETGYLVPWHREESFAERISLLLDDDGLRRTFGRAARETARSFAWDSIADAIETIYLRLLNRNSADSLPCVAAGL